MTLKDVGDLFEDLGNKTNVAGNIANIRNANDTAKILQLLEEQADPRLREARWAREAREREKTIERERIERVFKEVESQYRKKFPLDISALIYLVTVLTLGGLLGGLLAIPVLIVLFSVLVASLPFALLYCSCALLYFWRTGKSKKEVYLLPLRLCRKAFSPIIDRIKSRSINKKVHDDDFLTRYEKFLSITKIAVVSQSPFLEMDAEALVKHVGNGDIKIGDSFKYSTDAGAFAGIPARTLTKEIIERAEQEIEPAAPELSPKSSFRQLAKKDFGSTPVYQLLEEKGPDHAKCFKVAAVCNDRQFAPAWGRNKKEAEQNAACNALAQAQSQPIPYSSD